MTFVSLLSCNKEPLLDEAPSLVGTWQHYSAEDAWEIVYIESDGTGKVEWFTNNKLHEETNTKDWKVKQNRLYFGNVTFSLKPYTIDLYPTVIGANDTIGFDTLVQGNKYIQLNQLNFIKRN